MTPGRDRFLAPGVQLLSSTLSLNADPAFFDQWPLLLEGMKGLLLDGVSDLLKGMLALRRNALAIHMNAAQGSRGFSPQAVRKYQSAQKSSASISASASRWSRSISSGVVTPVPTINGCNNWVNTVIS
jgi:hypothetical protein